MARDVLGLLSRLAGARVLCVGDVMLDRYIYGEATRISPEAPVPVVRVRCESLAPGGVGNVVRNIAGTGAATHVVSVVGDDADAALLRGLLVSSDATPPDLIRDSSRPTSVKTRIIAGIQQVARFDEEATAPLSSAVEDRLIARIGEILERESVNAVAVSDYGKGVVSERLIREIRGRTDAPMVVDPKGVNYRRYAGADLVKPNTRELAEAAGMAILDMDSVIAAGRELMESCGLRNLLVTLGDKGMVLLPGKERRLEPVKFPSRAREVFDVTGAGDTVLAFLAVSLAVGASLEAGAQLATYAAGVVVGKVGTAPATSDEVARYVRNHLRE
ncbi:MAG: PfkB family carbohydrate kinase [Planctomycetota bacterium]|nr:PfkB family carbohydrate kinase [Planctomycetota bacterium]